MRWCELNCVHGIVTVSTHDSLQAEVADCMDQVAATATATKAAVTGYARFRHKTLTNWSQTRTVSAKVEVLLSPRPGDDSIAQRMYSPSHVVLPAGRPWSTTSQNSRWIPLLIAQRPVGCGPIRSDGAFHPGPLA
jgi:hypothetical protein